MPVEINELVIKATITTRDGATQQAKQADTDNQGKIQQLLDDVMKKLNEKEER